MPNLQYQDSNADKTSLVMFFESPITVDQKELIWKISGYAACRFGGEYAQGGWEDHLEIIVRGGIVGVNFGDLTKANCDDIGDRSGTVAELILEYLKQGTPIRKRGENKGTRKYTSNLVPYKAVLNYGTH